MPSMNEIYENYALEYDELVNHEDYKQNLKKWITVNLNLDKKTVLEYGVGTRRLTQLYIDQVKHAFCVDRSNHMLNKCKENLIKYNDKITYQILHNEELIEIASKVDVVIEGWSFGHTIVDNKDKIYQTIKQLVSNVNSVLNDDGKIIIIETLGSNVEEPNPPSIILSKFYSILENEYGFVKEVIETDYRFPSVEEAYRIFSFFFGKEIAIDIQKNNREIIKEYTGIWHKIKS